MFINLQLRSSYTPPNEYLVVIEIYSPLTTYLQATFYRLHICDYSLTFCEKSDVHKKLYCLIKVKIQVYSLGLGRQCFHACEWSDIDICQSQMCTFHWLNSLVTWSLAHDHTDMQISHGLSTIVQLSEVWIAGGIRNLALFICNGDEKL